MINIGKIKRNLYYVAAMAVLLVFAYLHLLDVRAGAEFTGDTWLIRQYQILLVLCLAGIGAIGWLLCHKKKLEQVYLVAGLLFGLLYLVVLPPLSAPDEISHYISAYQLSNHMLGEPSNYKTGHVLIRSEDWFIEDVYGHYHAEADEGILVHEGEGNEDATVLGKDLNEEAYRIIFETGVKHIDRGAESLAVSTYPPVITTPAAYVPQALGISLARVLGLNSLGLLYLGRLFNLLFFVGITYLAMRKLPFGKEVLFAVALLPMTLHLSASFSYDVILMAGMFFFSAYCLDLAYAKSSVRATDVICLAAVMAVVGPCKIVYAVFMGLCLLIPIRKFGSRGRWVLSAAVVAGAWILATVLVNSQTIAAYATETESYVAWAGEPGYSLAMMIHNPGKLIKLFYNTIIWQTEHYHQTMIGAYLGNLDLVLDVPYAVVMLLTGCLLIISFKKPGEAVILTGKSRAWIAILCLACTGALLLSMLIAWTPASSQIISGVQGRYFLPFLPVLLMICKNNYIVITENKDNRILYLMCCVNGYVLLRLFSIVCLRV